MNADRLKDGRQRLTRVFQYLQALNQHRNPVTNQIGEQLWHFWLRDLPNHPSIRKGQSINPRTGDSPIESSESYAPEGYVLKVARPKLTNAPQPNQQLAVWLNPGWDDPFKDTTHVISRNMGENRGEPSILRFEDDSERVEEFSGWKSKRDEWAVNEQPARAAMKIFEKFYGLYGRIEREAERVELVIGTGVLNWRRATGGVSHPILLQRLQLVFNPSGPEFTVIETETPPELYSALFQAMTDVDGRVIARCRMELEQGGYSPLGGNDTAGYLRRVVAQLSASGEFVEDAVPQGEKDYPRISHSPVLFLRSRSLGFAAAIEAVIEDLRTCDELSWPLLNIVGIETAADEPVGFQSVPNGSWTEPEDVLLSKPANPEQIRIAQGIDLNGGVLVQGPPGTGKTHTVANLIGHLLAHGKSVLVTSHTTKALRMVREHVVEELQPLCVSVLENDLEGRKQLQGAVGSIAEKLSRADARTIDREAADLSKVRRQLNEKLNLACQRFVDARTDEYRDVVFGGKEWPPSEAARRVSEDGGQSLWIPQPIALGVSLPLSRLELIELYRTNATLTAQDERELSGVLPQVAEFLTPQAYEALLREKSSIGNTDVNFGGRFWADESSSCTPEQLEDILSRIETAVDPISGKEAWKLEAILAGQNGLPDREPWDQLLVMMEKLGRMSGSYRASLLHHGPKVSANIPLNEQSRLSEEISEHLANGGNLGFFTSLRHREWKRFISDCEVSSGAPSNVEHFRALGKQARLTLSRRELAGRWDRQMAIFGAPASSKLGEEIERALPQFAESIRKCLEWHALVWGPLLKELIGMGFLWDKFLNEEPIALGNHGALRRLHRSINVTLAPVLSSRANKVRLSRITTQLLDLRIRLSVACKNSRNADVVERLLAAANSEDADAYLEALGRLVELQFKKEDLKTRQNLLARLETEAPAWATAIRDRISPHDMRDLPGNAEDAWAIQQLRTELKKRGSVSLEAIQTEIEDLKSRLRAVTVELIDRLSWGFQVKRTSLPQRQALIGWLQTWKAIGAGHGIRVPRLKAEAAEKMTACRGAVPVWIMPLSRVVENFDPRKTRFDVVIIDEASQSDVMALVACYMGRRTIVVGDNEQVSPSAVGQDLTVIQNLIDTHLQGIPNGQLYDGRRSIYDLAEQSFGQKICLVEHFRCVPEIIQFSNDLCYQGRIKPLRDTSRVQLLPGIRAHRVISFGRQGKINFDEASAITALVVSAMAEPEYKKNAAGEPVSFGIVSLVGEEQAIEIEQQLRRRLSPDEYERRRILCGTAAQFQGDERDVVIVSLVDVPTTGPLPHRESEMFKQRFNVGASRARDQMWVVHSLNYQVDLKPGDLRRRLIEHALDPSQLLRTMNAKSSRVESEFERLVLRHLLHAGYRVTPQWKVGAYRIDLVVEGGNRRLAIECDGDRFHPVEKFAEDMERQAILERLGWRFLRIRGSEFFLDQERTMRRVFARLQALEIPAEGLEVKATAVDSDLADRVIRRAEGLLGPWEEERQNSTSTSSFQQV